VEAGPPTNPIRPAEKGVKPARAVPGFASTLRITATASSGSKVSACSTQMTGAVASCTPRLIAAARPRVSCRTKASALDRRERIAGRKEAASGRKGRRVCS
jgi:hypothetical protein